MRNYVTLNERFGTGGVRYVITEASEGAPLTATFRRMVAELFPNEVASGALDVIQRPPPPPGWTGLSAPRGGILDVAFGPF